MLTIRQKLEDDRGAARLALEGAVAGYPSDERIYVRKEHLRELLDEVDDLRSQIGSLKNAIDAEVDAVRIHETLAFERGDTTAELAWRIRGDWLERASAI